MDEFTKEELELISLLLNRFAEREFNDTGEFNQVSYSATDKVEKMLLNLNK